MLEKLSKKFGGKVADSAVEGAKTTLNDRLDKYSDIIQIGLVVGVIALGGKMIGHGRKQEPAGYLPGVPEFNGTPIVINNYYTQNPTERNPYSKKEVYARHAGKGQKCNQKR